MGSPDYRRQLGGGAHTCFTLDLNANKKMATAKNQVQFEKTIVESPFRGL
jgi:hypothetical protein